MAKRSRKTKAGEGRIATVAAPNPRMIAWTSSDWLLSLILFAAVIVTYAPVWWAGFVWDDGLVLTANPVIIGPFGLREIWTTGAADICPLTLTTFWIEHALWGLTPLPYHLVNVVLHTACAIALFRVLLSLQVPGAWLGAALWALHPVEVASTAWVAEMKNTQSGLFFLLSILCFVKWVRVGRGKANAFGWTYVLTLFFAALGIASKSSTVVLPIVLGICAWWMDIRWRWRNLAVLGPVALLSACSILLTLSTQTLKGPEDLQWARDFTERLITAGDAVWFYLGKLFWPHPLMLVYPRWQIDPGQIVSYLPLMAVMILLLVFWLNRKTWGRPYFIVWAYFLTALLPVLGLIDGFFWRYSLVGDHFQYLASMGPLALAGAGLRKWTQACLPAKPFWQNIPSLVFLPVLGAMSWQRATVFKDGESLWTDNLAHNPSCWVAYNNLGNVRIGQKRLEEGITLYQKALEIHPNFSNAHTNIGNALAEAGQVDQAILQYKAALEINPNLAGARGSLGDALLQKGRVNEAIEQYQSALAIDPIFAEARSNLGLALLRQGKIDEALVQCQDAVAINPESAESHNNLGLVLLNMGHLDDAAGHFQVALDLKPTFAEAHNDLGIVLARTGRIEEALAHFQKAVEIKPSDSQMHSNLGAALLQRGQISGAISELNEALRLNPASSDAQMNLAKAQELLRRIGGAK